MSKLLIQEPPLQVLPTLAKTIGLNGAIVIQQLHYWLENPKIGRVVDGEKWVDNSYAEWQENFPFWSVATIKRIFADLEESGFVISGQFDKSDWSQRKSYRIVYETLDSINLTQSSVSNRAALNKELTETTTETAANAASLDVQAITESANRTVDGVIEASRLAPKVNYPKRDSLPDPIRELLDAFVEASGIKPKAKETMGWMSAAQDWLNLHVTAKDVRDVIEYAKGKFTVSTPFSLTNTLRARKASVDNSQPIRRADHL